MLQALPGDVRLEHVAPEIHVGSEEVWPQVLKELDAAYNEKN
jgi:hypothetical protein